MMIPVQSVIDPKATPRLRVGLKWDALEKDIMRATDGFGSNHMVLVNLVITSVYSTMHWLFVTILALSGKFPPWVADLRRKQKAIDRSLTAMRAYLGHGEQELCDLDLVGFCYGKEGQLIAVVAPYPVKIDASIDVSAALHHSGDERTGISSGFDEELIVDLALLDERVQHIFLVVASVHHGFDQIKAGQCAVIERKQEQTLLTHDLVPSGERTYIFAALQRAADGWTLRNISRYCTPDADADWSSGATIDDILRKDYVTASPS